MQLGINNPRIVNFLTENYEKEAESRVYWNHKHKERLQEAATFTRPPKNYFESDVQAYSMSEGMSTTNRDFISGARNRRQVPLRDAKFIPGVNHLRRRHSIVDVGLGDPKEDPRLIKADYDLTPEPIMRPVDPKIAKIRIKEGSEKYLHERVKSSPEQRYYFAECVNWDYGWRLKDSMGSWKAIYGRHALMMKALNERVGPQPDPPHYQAADLSGANKCKDS